jgi:hypothetical protein
MLKPSSAATSSSVSRLLAFSAAAARSVLVRQQAAIAERFETLAALDREPGPARRTTERFNVLRDNWRFGADRTANVESSNADYLYVLLIGEIRSMIPHVGDQRVCAYLNVQA